MILREIGADQLVLIQVSNVSTWPKEVNVDMEITVKELIIELKSFITLRNIKSSFALSTLMTLILVNMANSAHLLITLKKSR